VISFLDIAIGLFSVLGVATLYTFICWGVGAGFSEKADLATGVRIPVAFVMGTAVLSWFFSVLGMLSMLPGWGIGMGCVLGTGCALLFARRLNIPVGLKVHGPSFDRKSNQIIEILLVLLALVYVFSLCIGWPRGGDQCIYHLVIPRSVLWNHGLVFNGFSHDAGMYYGWQMACLPAFYLGLERGFFLMSFFCFMLFLFFILQGAEKIGLQRVAWLLVAVAAFTTVGMVRESLVNNEAPLLLVEACLLWMAAFPSPSKNTRFEAWCFGSLCGFMVGIKLISLAVLPLLLGLFLWRRPVLIWPRLWFLGAGFVFMIFPWIAYTYWKAGTILPVFMLIWPPRWGVLPQMVEGMAYHMKFSGIWLKSNYHLLFSQGMELYLALLVAGIASAIFLSNKRYPINRVSLFLAGYGLCRWLLIWIFSGLQPAAFFHNRYNLMTYIVFGCAAALSINDYLKNYKIKTLVQCVKLIVIAGICFWFFASPKVNSPMSLTEQIVQKYPSLWEGICNSLSTLKEGPGGGAGGIGLDWVDQNLPKDSVVATTAIDPYLMNRPFVQILPICQTQIDLNSSPELIYEKLLDAKATHLHITEFSGLNGWLNPIIDKTLVNVKNIPEKEKLQVLLVLNYRDGKGYQSLYTLNKQKEKAKRPFEIKDIKIRLNRNKLKNLTWDSKTEEVIDVNFKEGNKIEKLGTVLASLQNFPLGNQLGKTELYRFTVQNTPPSILIEKY